MNSFFINIAKNLQLKKDIKSKLNKLEGILKVFESHSSIDKSKKLSILLKVPFSTYKR